MPATKIINVSKGDSFEEVFDLFQRAVAQEVILIIPKGSKLAKQQAHFTVLKKEADSSDKDISIMTEDPVVENLAQLCGIQVLSGQSIARPKIHKVAPQPIVRVATTAIAVEEEESEDQNPQVAQDDNQEEYPDVQFAAAMNTPRRKRLDDIIRDEAETTLPIKEDKRVFKVDIKKSDQDTRARQGHVADMEALWSHQQTNEDRKPLHSVRKKGRFHLRWPHLGFKKLPVIVVGVAVILFGVAYLTLGSAKIVIQPKKEKLDFKVNITASPNFSVIDLKLGQIPGQQFSIQKEVSDTFPLANEKAVAQKARGRIQIFNNNVGKSQRLVATTRFESEKGLIFRIPQTITVPGATKTTDGAIAPGSIESEIYADKPGPEYNLGPSSFTVPGFKGLPQYTQFSGLAIAPITGGLIGSSKVVTEEDIVKAQTVLESKLKAVIASGLKDKILNLKVISQYNIKIESPIINAKVGEAATELKMTLRGSINSIAFREADLTAFIDDYFKNNEGLDQAHSQLDKNYENQAFDSQASKLSFSLHISGTAAVKVADQNKIITDIQGMKADQIKAYFNNLSEIGSVKVVLSPFWVRSIPRNPAKIQLTVE